MPRKLSFISIISELCLSTEEQIKQLTDELTEFFENFRQKIDDLYERCLNDRYKFYVDNGQSSLNDDDFREDNFLNVYTTKHGQFYKIKDQFVKEKKIEEEQKITVPTEDEANIDAESEKHANKTFKEAALEVLPKTSIFNLVQNMQGALFIDCLEDYQDEDDEENENESNNNTGSNGQNNGGSSSNSLLEMEEGLNNKDQPIAGDTIEEEFPISDIPADSQV